MQTCVFAANKLITVPKYFRKHIMRNAKSLKLLPIWFSMKPINVSITISYNAVCVYMCATHYTCKLVLNKLAGVSRPAAGTPIG